ncbi:MAG: hypothetical protein R3242_02855 [Akkermansiaceae bacterium]|nr:hypothetical protein [Akkermansiaceae bacterium]
MPHSPDDIQYALETTEVLHEPDRRIDTFGDTRFEFQLISELLDNPDQVRIRSGHVEAQRPRILKPEAYTGIELEGFNESAKQRLDEMIRRYREAGHNLAFLQYGFEFRRGEVREELVHEPLEQVRDKVMEDLRQSGNPALAIIQGVDDTWEASLLKFSLEMIMRSHEINAFDFKRRGMI